MIRALTAFRTDEQGATALEYGLIAAIISLVIMGGSGSIRSALWGLYTGILSSFTTAS